MHIKVDDPPTGSGGSLECRESNNVLDTGLRLNQAPSVGAGADRTITLPVVVAALAGSVTDDGLPVGSPVTATWSVVSGPGPVTFANPAEATTTATFEVEGTYTLRLTATDTRLTAFDDMAVTVTPPNQAPVVSAGEDQTITLPPTDTVTLNGSVSDDGLPIGASVSVTWSLVSGPAGVLLSSPFEAVTPATFTAPGTYVLRLTATDTALTATDDVVVSVLAGNTPPVVSAGADQTVLLSNAGVALLGAATDDGLPSGSTIAVSWSLLSGPAPVSFSNPASLATTASFEAPGGYVLLLTATDGVLSASDDVGVTVQAGPPVGDPPVVTLTSPTDGSAITQPVDIVGRVSSDSLANWKLQIRRTGETTFSTLAAGSTPVDGVITRFDPTLLLNGLHEVVFRATDTAGRIRSTVITAVVKDNQKVGNFTVSFADLEVPVAGLPIRVTRTYDSRDKGIGDFGVGWRVDLSNARVQESAQAGLLWYGDKIPGFIATYCLTPTRAAIVSITTPDGRVHEFEPVITPQCTTGAPMQVVTYAFRPRPGTTTQGTLSVVGNNHVLPVGSWPGPMQLYGETDFRIFDPSTYLLTLPDGRQFEVNQPRGLTRVRDLSGNTLNVTSEGITFQNPDVPGSTKGIVFTRDALGRITAITDPSGESATYGYDANGDLASFTDREQNTTRFTYEPAFPHHLKEIKDPLGRTPIKNDYYPDGRIKSHTDAFGKTITYTHDVGGRQEIVVDREGAQRVLEYDERGNVLKETQPDGKVIRRTFDGRQNRLTETEPYDPANPPSPIPTTVYTYDSLDNPLSITDPASNTTSYTYNSRKQVLTTTDAKGKVTTNEYDPKGNLLKTTDALTNVTSYTYDTQGNVLSQTVTVDGVTQVTRYEYDAFGNLKKETDALGHETSYTYDPSGNRLTQTTTRTTPSGIETLLTTYTHDKLGRLTRTTDPDNTYTETAYDALGKQLSTRDKLGRITSYTYDDMGRLTKTTHADTTTDESTYDGEGRRLWSKDRAGRTTTYEYDLLGRLKKTIYPDLSFTTSTYDAAGRLAASTDARGKTTSYEYDSAGRRTKVKDALGNETVFTYDANGNQKTVRDARLNTTTYEYDELNRRTRTIFPPADVDGPMTFTMTGYDAVGRRVSETDQAGKTTRFEYDKLGRLTAVVDALDHRTAYGYDEIGNRTSQTDANGHVTRFEYDKLGRQTKRILPGASSESMTYDTAGNLKTRTDFMARTTTYDYDVNNRLLSRSYPDSTSVGFTYTQTGRRRTAVDARGTTTYDYDTRDRLTSIDQPGVGSLGYSYDGNGNRLTVTATIGPDTHTTSYTYDDASRLDIVTDPATGGYDHGYDANGNRTSLAHPNGAITAYTYDNLNRLTNLGTTIPSLSRTIQSYAFTLGPAGNRTKITEHDGTLRDYTYDSLYRLTGDRVTETIGLVYEKTFGYDSVGNRQSQTTTLGPAGSPGPNLQPGTISYGYDDRDRLTLEGAQVYTWDDNGNLTTKDAEATYTWDFENRLTKVTKTDGTMVEHLYDADGNRVQTKTTPPAAPTTTTNFLVDTSGSLSYVIAETDDAGNLKAYYVRGDDLLAVMRPNDASGWTSRFYHADGIGSIRRLTDESGSLTDGYTYSAFGELLSHTGADPQLYAFAGEPYDPDVGFQYHRARWMDPSVGRFVGMDPLLGNEFDPPSLHRYLYAGADPASKIDPTGRDFTVASLMTVSGVLNTINAISLGVTVFTTAFQATTIAYRLSTDDQYELEDALEDARKVGTTAAVHVLLNFAAPLAAGRIISQLGTLGLIRLGNVARANGLLAEHLIANANGLWVALRKVPLPTGGIPDFVTKTALHEIKNGARLLWSNRKLRDQLIEYATYCAQTGKEMVLHVRPGARVGSNLISNLNQILQRAGGKPLQLIRDIPDHLRVIP